MAKAANQWFQLRGVTTCHCPLKVRRQVSSDVTCAELARISRRSKKDNFVLSTRSHSKKSRNAVKYHGSDKKRKGPEVKVDGGCCHAHVDFESTY
jgi:hypothetical protein